MAIYVNTDERMTHEDVARRLSGLGLTKLAATVRQLGHEADDQASRYASLLHAYGQLAHEANPAPAASGPPVSYKPSPMSDG